MMPIHINHINNTISTGENADVTGNNSIIFNNTGSIVLSRVTTGQKLWVRSKFSI
jgi:frataxin-like iron-binding protein CyaY